MGNWFNVASIKCCYECKERYPACHDNCEAYQTEKAEYDEAKSRVTKARAAIRDFDYHHYDAVVKQSRRNENKGKVKR